MSVELATAYVSLVPSARGIGSKVQSELGDPVAKAGDKAGQGFGSRVIDKVGKIAKGAGIGVLAAAGAGMGVALTKGLRRLTDIENAQAKLTGLGRSAAEVKSIMDNALSAVKGTAFGLGDAATIAASTVAAGVKPGRDLERTLKLVGDAATIGGTSMGEMGAIFNKVAASNKIQMGEINQLSDRGIPVLSLLADQLGVTTEEAGKMASAGKVDFATFQQAMEAGLGGAALKSADTTKGALANLGAAAGRFGEGLLKGVFPMAKAAFGGMTVGIDNLTTWATPRVEALSALVSDRLTGAFRSLSTWASAEGPHVKTVIAGVLASDTFSSVKTDTLDRLRSIFATLTNTVAALGPPLGQIIGSLAQASASVGVSVWQLLLVAVDGLAKVTAAVLVPTLTLLSDLMAHNQGVVTALVGAYTAWRLVNLASTLATATIALGVQTAAIATNSVAWVRNTAALLVSKAQTVALMAMYAGEFLAGIARVTVALTAQAAAWVAQNAAAIAFKAVQLAITVGTAAWTAAQWLLNVALNANPIGLIVLAIAALIAIIILVISNLDFFRGIWDSVWKFCSDLITTVTGWIRDRWQDLWSWLTGLWSGITGFFSGIWEGVVSGVRTAVGWVTNAWQSCIDGIKGFFSGLASFAENVWTGITNAVKSVINGVIGIVNGAIGGVNDITGVVGIPAIPKIPKLATGGIVTSPTLAMVGEAGDEAVIPLRRMHEFMGEAGKQADQPDPLANIGAAVAEALSGWQVQLDGNGLARLVNNSNVRRARRG